MDEYDYLEAQLEAPAPAQEQQQLPGPPPVVADGEGPRENGHRSSSRGKSKDRDRKRSRSRDKERRRSRERSRERRRSRSPRSRRDRDHDRYAGGGRGDRDRRRDDNRPRGPERGRDRERGPGGPPPGVRRDTTPPEVRLQREKEQELKDLERTVRTVMVMNLNLRANERDIFEHFVQVGPINDIKLICDKNTRKSKGIAYIEFGSVEAAISALTLNGQIMMNMPVLVKPSEAEKNLQWEAQQQAKQNQASAMSLLNKMGGTAPGVKANPIKLQILNLHPDVGEEDLKDLFLPFGEINYIKVVRDPAGMSTGEAYIQYADEPMANNAIHHYNGFELAGRKLLVQVAPLFTPALLPPIPGVVPLSGGAAAPSMPPMPGMLPGMALPGPPPLPPGTVLPGMPGGGVNPAAAVLASLPGPPALPDQVAATVGVGEVDDLDEAENRSFKLNAQSRAALMSRLATSAGLQAPPTFLGGTAPTPAAAAPAAPAAPVLNVPQHVLLDQGLLGPASPKPTPCLLLKNMFADADKEDPDWQTGVAEDVRSEASKFGPVLHCHLEPNSQGHVYLKFAQPEQAEAAYKALHGRYYAGNQIVVSFQFLQPYNNFFGLK